MSNPYDVVKQFEASLCEYTGAKYAVTTNSCTMALLLCCAYFRKLSAFTVISIPKKTYVSVPQSIKHAGFSVEYEDIEWTGSYRLNPLPIWDCARAFTSGMYIAGNFQCVSFHASKILGDSQGGAILHDDDEADSWLRRARFDGRTEGVHPKVDNFEQVGWHCYMSNDVAARLLLKLSVLPKHNSPLPNDDYPDLSKIEVFK